MSDIWNKISGTQLGKFILGFTGVTLKNNDGSLEIRNNADDAYSNVIANTLIIDNNDGNVVNITASAHSTATNWTLDLPSDGGTPGQVLSTDGTGRASWVTVGGGGYILPIASSATLGGVKVGANLIISGDGTLSSTAAGGNLDFGTFVQPAGFTLDLGTF